jgi:hypothetical protein
MTKNVSLILQIIAMAGQAAIPQFNLAPDIATSLHALLGALSVGHVVRAHRFNSDGTSQSVAYVPPVPQKPYFGWSE